MRRILARFSFAATFLVALPALAAEAAMDFKATLIQALGGLALSALTILGGLALHKLSQWADAKKGESKLGTALAVLPHAAEAIWAEVTADLSDDIKAALADGKIDPAELAHLKAEALKELKEALAKHGLGALKDAFGPLLDGVLGKAIGAAQARLTAGTPAPLAAAAASPQ